MNNNFENMNFPRLSVAAVVFFALLFCLYALLLKSPLGRGEPALENGKPAGYSSKERSDSVPNPYFLAVCFACVLTVACSFLSPQEVQRVFAPLLGRGQHCCCGGPAPGLFPHGLL